MIRFSLVTLVKSALLAGTLCLAAPCAAENSRIGINQHSVPLASAVAFFHPLPLGQEGPVLEMAFFKEELNAAEANALRKIVSVGSTHAVRQRIGKAPLVHLSFFFKKGATNCNPDNIRLAFLTFFTNPSAPFPHRGETISFTGKELEEMNGFSDLACDLEAGEPVQIQWAGNTHAATRAYLSRRGVRHKFSWNLIGRAMMVHQ